MAGSKTMTLGPRSADADRSILFAPAGLPRAAGGREVMETSGFSSGLGWVGRFWVGSDPFRHQEKNRLELVSAGTLIS